MKKKTETKGRVQFVQLDTFSLLKVAKDSLQNHVYFQVPTQKVADERAINAATTYAVEVAVNIESIIVAACYIEIGDS